MNPLAPETLRMLRCPVTRSELTVASSSQVAFINQKIEAREIVNQLGQSVTDPVQGLLISGDRKVGCAIRAGIIQMIADEALVIPETMTLEGDAS